MPNYFNLDKTGEEVDAILNGVIGIDINPTGVVATEHFNSIKIGDTAYALEGVPSGANYKIYKHTFSFAYGSLTLNGVAFSNRSNAYAKPYDMFANLTECMRIELLGAEILNTSISNNNAVCSYIHPNGTIATFTVTQDMIFTSYQITPY